MIQESEHTVDLLSDGSATSGKRESYSGMIIGNMDNRIGSKVQPANRCSILILQDVFPANRHFFGKSPVLAGVVKVEQRTHFFQLSMFLPAFTGRNQVDISDLGLVGFEGAPSFVIENLAEFVEVLTKGFAQVLVSRIGIFRQLRTKRSC